MKEYEFISIFGILVSVISGLIGIYAQSINPETGIFMFVSLLGAIVLYFLISFIFRVIKNKVNHINKNSEDIIKFGKDLNNLIHKLNLKEEINNLNLRMSILENVIKGKKAQIDPRWIIIIVILILLYFYLKSKRFI